MISAPLVNYVLTAAIRDKLVLSLILAIGVSLSMSAFLGSSAIVEQGSFALVYAMSSIRLLVVAGLVLFIVFFVRRAFDTKEIEYFLTAPLGRITYILSNSLGFSILACLFGGVITLALFALEGQSFSEGHIYWSVTIIIEFLIIVNVALFFSMVVGSPTIAAMAVLAFYFLARLMSQVLGIIDAGITSEVLRPFEILMQVISSVMPRLDLMGQTAWLIYGAPDNLSLIFFGLQGFIFIGLVLSAACLDLIRKQF